MPPEVFGKTLEVIREIPPVFFSELLPEFFWELLLEVLRNIPRRVPLVVFLVVLQSVASGALSEYSLCVI